MIKRTLEVSQEALHLSVKLDQLQLTRRGAPGKMVASVPCEDIGLVVVDHPGATFTQAALSRLVEFGAAVMVCGPNHLPSGLLLPLSTNHEVVWRIHDQIAAPKPLGKRLWRQIVVAKIRNQAQNLVAATAAHRRLLTLAGEVKSGDPTNTEAQAAKVYWSAWLGEGSPFHRDPDGTDALNGLLNYGYAVLRAAVGRALVSAGLHPALGLHHCNRANAFCLADDLLEPLHPLVDREVRTLYGCGQTELNRAAKGALLGLLTRTVRTGDRTGPLMVALHRAAASLAKCFQERAQTLLLPEYPVAAG